MEPVSIEHIINLNIDRLKQEVRPIPRSGPFEKRSIEFSCDTPHFPASAQLIISPWTQPSSKFSIPNWKELRSIEVIVCTSDKKADSSTTIFSGTNEEIDHFLNDTEKVNKTVLASIKRCIESLQQDPPEPW